MSYGSRLNFITENPVTSQYDYRQKVEDDQRSSDLQNQMGQATLLRTLRMAPSEIQSAEAQARANVANADVAEGTKQDKIVQSGVDLGKSQEDLRHAQAYNPNMERSAAANASTNESQARVQTTTEGAQVADANNRAQGSYLTNLRTTGQISDDQTARTNNATTFAQEQLGAKTQAEENVFLRAIRDPEAAIAEGKAAGVVTSPQQEAILRNPVLTNAAASLISQLRAQSNDAAWRDAEFQKLFPQIASQPGGAVQGALQSALETAKADAPGQADKSGKPADIKEYEYAKEQGFKGSYMDWKASLKGQGMSVTTADGTTVQVGGTVKPPNESQMQAGDRAQLLQHGIASLEALYDNPDISPWNVGAADTVSALGGPLGRVAGSQMKSDAEQQFSAAKAAALEGLAASITGAGVTKDQFDRYSQMLPDITDKPETRKAKLKAANDYLNVVLANAGSAAIPVKKNMDQNAAELGRVPTFADPNDPALKALPKGSKFYSDDGQGNKTLRFVP